MTLEEFFADHPKVALAFSGGVDSAYLLYAALHYGAQVRAYYVQSAFQPQFEWEDAKRLAQEVGADLKRIPLDVLANPMVQANPKNRCYYCKSTIFSTILAAAKGDGFSILLDGTNASDDAEDRPGMQALEELKVLSPLRACGLTKDQVRQLSKEAGLFTWNKPAYACLATRIPAGTSLSKEKLERTEQAEDFLFGLGFSNFRIRMLGDLAKVQVEEDQLGLFLEKRAEILKELNKTYAGVVLDLEVRK